MTNNLIGLTGGIGCGKSTVTGYLSQKGVPIVDADIVAHEVVEPGTVALDKIQQHFGSEILKDNGHLDRAKLREIIFTDNTHKHWLESLLHPIIRDEICAQLEVASKHYPYVILSSPLLLETDQSVLVSKIIVIDIDRESQIQRASKRDGNTKVQIERIIANQIDRESRKRKADYIIDNCGDINNLFANIDALHANLRAKF